MLMCMRLMRVGVWREGERERKGRRGEGGEGMERGGE